jgi:hypothetical protein
MIEHLGLFPYMLQHLREFPPELHKHCGRGIGLWQYPNQFEPYIETVKTYFEGRGGLETYVEIGVAAGGTFMATCDLLSPTGAVAIDISPVIGTTIDDGRARNKTPFDGLLAAFIDGKTREFFCGTSRDFSTSSRCPATIDLLFVDGDHSYEGVKADFEALGPRSRVVVFHDIVSDACPGVVRFWREIVDAFPGRTAEFVDQYDSVTAGSFLGIGVLFKDEAERSEAERSEAERSEAEAAGEAERSEAERSEAAGERSEAATGPSSASENSRRSVGQ